MSLPNQLTILRILLTPVFIYLLFVNDIVIKYIALFIFLIATLTDWYDGYIARKYGVVTVWGKFLDPLADKVLVSSTLYALFFLDKVELWMVNIIVIRDFLITGLRSYAMFRGQPVVTSYLAKIKTFAQMTLVYIILILYIIEVGHGDVYILKQLLAILEKIQFVYISMFLITLLTVYTAIQYFIANRNHLQKMFVDLFSVIYSKRSKK